MNEKKFELNDQTLAVIEEIGGHMPGGFFLYKAEEPEELIDQLLVLSRFHHYFPSGTGDIFPIDVTVHRNPEYVLDIIKGAFRKDLRYLSFYSSDSDVIRVTGYLVKRSEMEKLDAGNAVLQDTTALGLGASKNGKILERKVR